MDPRKFVKCYVNHRNYINKGNNEVSTIRYIIQMVLIAKIAFPIMPMWMVALLGVLIITGFWVTGYYWDRIRGYQYEAEWDNKRNPTLQQRKRNV